MTSHCDGEVWGLDVITRGKGDYRILTSCDDNRILAYNPATHEALAEGMVSEPPEGKKKKEKPIKNGASSMSSWPAGNQSRAIAYNDTLKHLAVADNRGGVTIREIDWDAVDARTPGSLDKITKKNLFKDLKDKARWIEIMVYSPCNKYLAVGSHDCNIYVLDTKAYNFKKCMKLTGHSSSILGLDWAVDSSYIRSVC